MAAAGRTGSDDGESSEGSEAGQAEGGRWLAWTDERGMLCLAHLPLPALVGRLGNLLPEHSMQLLPGETVAQVPPPVPCCCSGKGGREGGRALRPEP